LIHPQGLYFASKDVYHLRAGTSSMRILLSCSLFGLMLLVACSGGNGRTTPSSPGIQHIVVIFDENISFDHYFGTYPVATNPPGEPQFVAAAGTGVPEGLGGALLAANPNKTNARNGRGASNPFRLDRAQAATADQDHSYGPEQTAFDNGAMDLFPFSVGAADSAALVNSTGANSIAATTGLTMGYYDGNTVTALWNYAQHYAMNDHSFGTTFGPSTVGAINLISGQTNGAVAGKNGAYALVSDGSGGFTLTGDANPEGDICSPTAAATISMTGKTIGDLLTAANVSWGWFQGGFDLTVTNPNGTTGCQRTTRSSVAHRAVKDYLPLVEPFQFYASTQNLQHTRPTSIAAIGTNADGANHQYDLHDFTDALAAGNMPAVSFLKPPSYQDGHAGFSDPLDEQTFLVDIVNAVEQSPFWQNTAIIIAYDDSDGWYDHLINIVNGSATPQDRLRGDGMCGSATATAANALSGVNATTLHAQGRCGNGPRMPLLVVSPWAKKNYIDATATDQTSTLRFIEDMFLGGERIGGGSFDSIAGSLSNMFDFSASTPPNPAVVLLDDATGEVTSGN
jgi:phospholipase C